MCVLVLSVTAFADPFIGFSANGKYLAYETSEYGGDAWDYEREVTYFVDTVKNSLAVAPSVYDWDQDKPEKLKPILYTRYKKNVALKMKKFGIVRGNLGFLVVSHLLYDWSYTKPVESLGRFTQPDGTEIKKMMPDYEGGYVPKDGGFSEKIIFNPDPDPDNFVFSTSKFYALTLNVIQIQSGENEGDYKIELTLKDHTKNRDIPRQILQKDSNELPKSRQGVRAYKIERVYVYSNKIAVVINVFGPNFEGQHISSMVVTGEMK